MVELESLLQRLRAAASCLGSFDGWDRWGRSSADAAQVQQMEAEATAAMADQQAAQLALDALVGRLRAEAPHELAAWADAHDALLAAYLASDDARGPYADAAVQSATEARAEWAEVKAGTRSYSLLGDYAEQVATRCTAAGGPGSASPG